MRLGSRWLNGIGPLFLFLCAPPASAQVPTTYDGNCPEAVKQLAESLRSKYNAPGLQIAMASNGSIYCAGAVGFADTAAQRRMTPTTLMRIGSVSKTLTGM